MGSDMFTRTVFEESVVVDVASIRDGGCQHIQSKRLAQHSNFQTTARIGSDT